MHVTFQPSVSQTELAVEDTFCANRRDMALLGCQIFTPLKVRAASFPSESQTHRVGASREVGCFSEFTNAVMAA